MVLGIFEARHHGGSHAAPRLDHADDLVAILDAVQANLFVASPDLELVYMNRRAEQTVAAIEPAIREVFGVGLADLLHGSIHRFHRDPARVEQILRDRSSFPHQAEFTFGTVTLTTNINGVFDADGRVRGYVVAWDDVTEQRRIEASARALAGDVSVAAESLTESSQELSVNAEESSAQAQTVASAAEEMASSLHEVAAGAQHATALASEGVGAVEGATATVDRLRDSSTQVGEIVGMITAIAEQTNLLALNATIEARAAGEAGKGFAVVASEVKELARSTAEATERITRIVDAIRSDSAEATEALRRVTEIIEAISDQQQVISGAVAQETAATEEIASSITGVATAATMTSAVVATLLTKAEQLSSSAHRLEELVVAEHQPR